MGLRATIQAAVVTGFVALGDVPEACTYNRVTAGTYNLVSGSPDETVTTLAVDAVFVAYGTREIENEAIQPGDMQALITSQALALEPQVGDEITRGSETWTVVAVKVDPARALWALQVRQV